MSKINFKRALEGLKNHFPYLGIRYAVFLSFTITAVLAITLTALTIYLRFSHQIEETVQNENRNLVEQAKLSLNTYLRDMIGVSDALYYNIIKNNELEADEIDDKFELIYNTYSSYIDKLVVFSSEGEILTSAPAASLSKDADVTSEEWFLKAKEKPENFHFFNPRVERVFAGTDYSYDWVVYLSSSVEITKEKDTEQGVLLIVLKYNGISQLFENIRLSNDGYVYLMDDRGNIIYHPYQQLLASGIKEENNLELADYKDGNYEDKLFDEERSVIINTVGYTGWRVVGIVSTKDLVTVGVDNVLFLLIVLLLLLEMLILVNTYITNKITYPIKRLEESLKGLEEYGNKREIFIGGYYEVRSLGISIQNMVDRLKQLTEEIVEEHVEKQKSELNALQAQINPHFLYNTLDIIVWMIEQEEYEGAVRAVTALGRFFRISISKGKNIITVANELEHVENYLLIQEYRYKDKFKYRISVDKEVMNMSTIKLAVQPLVENAIYHSMDYMDGDGLINIRAFIKDGRVNIAVEDNGMGMTEETVTELLKSGPKSSKGSGIGLRNVHERIKLYFGEEYGVAIESKPDHGTCITLVFPAIPYGELEENNSWEK
ncbi:sensor histidine kinase [Alloiococcus sp. CFN-8]|uniref:sensor histidine kinase n=1 Tax=Alloiococcus sp. CFN-8 TaxID=3416081 RepID=UPI003CFB527E